MGRTTSTMPIATLPPPPPKTYALNTRLRIIDGSVYSVVAFSSHESASFRGAGGHSCGREARLATRQGRTTCTMPVATLPPCPPAGAPNAVLGAERARHATTTRVPAPTPIDPCEGISIELMTSDRKLEAYIWGSK